MRADKMIAMVVVTASANPGKVAEIQALFSAVLPSVELLPRPPGVPEVVEDADTLVGNARLKARALVEATGMPAVADDTGLFVHALDGRPGVHTARFAGENATYADNCRMMLSELDRVGAVTSEERGARFVTVAMIAYPDGSELSFEGHVDGTIAPELRGSGGFGYDPLFIPVGGGGFTFAELGPAAKNELSHRGQAFRGLAELLQARVPTDK
jgi:XTP/dITP diphosphohydrolase